MLISGKFNLILEEKPCFWSKTVVISRRTQGENPWIITHTHRKQE